MDFRYYLTWILLILMLNGQAQDPVLFSVDQNEVPLSEFEYIFDKTNRNQDVHTEESIQEYLDLYIKFKLKVRKARSMQLDTIPTLKNELDGYRKQLASNYLTEKTISDALCREAYDRMTRDVAFSHILITLPLQASREDSTRALARAKEILNKLNNGMSFSAAAKQYSDDNNNNGNGGRVGWVNAMMSDGFYDLETAVYETEVGSIAGPIHSKMGLHIIKKDDERPARQKIEVAHILARSSKHADPEGFIELVEKEIRSGMMSFEEAARQRSDDKKAARNGGALPAFGINEYQQSFEDAAFALKNDGDISEPIQSKFGWHIIKRIQKIDLQPFEVMKRALLEDIKKDGRFAQAEKALQERLKQDNGFQSFDWNKERFLTDIDNSWLSYRWDVPESIAVQHIFQIGNRTYSTDGFIQFLQQNPSLRLQVARNQSGMGALNRLVAEYISASVLSYEEENLEKKYPEFKSLMREYEEGILLFEATKMNVWDKASRDSIGLHEFFAKNRNSYTWPAKAVVQEITLLTANPKMIKKLQKSIQKEDDRLKKMFNKKEELLVIESAEYEEEKLPDNLQWQAPFSTSPTTEGNRTSVMRITEIKQPELKEMNEARGYIIADYQDELEDKWIEALRQEYEVIVNEDVLTSFIETKVE